MGVVGSISLLLSFFLLMVSTSQNIKESLWEYGCLRAMGMTQSQGLRAAMYEQYSLVLSALLLGTGTGLVLACLVTAQFFLFLEFPFRLIFPLNLVIVMYLLAIITSYVAVRRPIDQVNKQQVAQTIKGNS